MWHNMFFYSCAWHAECIIQLGLHCEYYVYVYIYIYIYVPGRQVNGRDAFCGRNLMIYQSCGRLCGIDWMNYLCFLLVFVEGNFMI